MRTLITGGAGFVGSHLCERFLAEGHDVLCVDNFITGNPVNVQHLPGNPRFTFVRHNISHALERKGFIRRLTNKHRGIRMVRKALGPQSAEPSLVSSPITSPSPAAAPTTGEGII